MINDKNPSQTIAEMAQQRYQPTASEQKMIGQFDQRQVDLERIAKAGGGAVVLPDTVEAENAEKTARWAAEDAAAKLGRGPGNNYQGAVPSFAEQQLQASLGHRARQRAELAFENGGKPETAEELLARLSGKYGVSNQTAPAPQVQAPAPKPQAAPQPGGLIQQAAGILGGRTKAIDKAAGYAQGGKIKGPGTATSDSIPAVTGSGQSIRVANGERIVSVEQDKALERIAELLNYESVDAMFEALTGKPVGPTVKGGRIAAAAGMAPEDQYGQASATTSLAPLNGQTTRAGSYPSKLEQAVTGASVVPAAPNVARGDVGPSVVQRQLADEIARRSGPERPAPYSNEGRSVPHPISVPASRAAGASILAVAQPVDNTPPMPLTTRDVVPGGYLDRGAGILAQRGAAGLLNVTNVGTEALTDRSKQIVDGSAGALRDQQSNNQYWSPEAQLERMQRRRLTTDATDPSITEPGVKADAQKGLLILNAGRQGEAQANAQNAQARLHTSQAVTADQMVGLHREYLDPKTTPERRTELHGIIRALSGKERDPVNLQAIDVEEPIDPKQPLLGNRKIPYVFDPRAGTSRPMLQPQQPTYSQTDLEHTAKKYGMTVEQVKAKLAGAR